MMQNARQVCRRYNSLNMALVRRTFSVGEQSLCSKDNKYEKMSAQELLKPMTNHKTTDFERTVMVWGKAYKTKEEIPEFMSYSSLQKGLWKARIKVCNYMIVAICIGYAITIFYGKQAQARGESLGQYEMEARKKYKDESAS